MEKIYSNINKDQLLHMVMWVTDFKSPRQNIIPDENYLQCAAIRMNDGDTFKAHQHIYSSVSHSEYIPQEAWVVIRGYVIVYYYDIDGSFLCERHISEGDMSITLHGGHNYLCMDDNTLVYEFKSGPYLGQQFDKTFIDE